MPKLTDRQHKLLAAALENIEADPASFTQLSYGDGEPSCRTPACIAGHIVSADADLSRKCAEEVAALARSQKATTTDALTALRTQVSDIVRRTATDAMGDGGVPAALRHRVARAMARGDTPRKARGELLPDGSRRLRRRAGGPERDHHRRAAERQLTRRRHDADRQTQDHHALPRTTETTRREHRAGGPAPRGRRDCRRWERPHAAREADAKQLPTTLRWDGDAWYLVVHDAKGRAIRRTGPYPRLHLAEDELLRLAPDETDDDHRRNGRIIREGLAFRLAEAARELTSKLGTAHETMALEGVRVPSTSEFHELLEPVEDDVHGMRGVTVREALRAVTEVAERLRIWNEGV